MRKLKVALKFGFKLGLNPGPSAKTKVNTFSAMSKIV